MPTPSQVPSPATPLNLLSLGPVAHAASSQPDVAPQGLVDGTFHISADDIRASAANLLEIAAANTSSILSNTDGKSLPSVLAALPTANPGNTPLVPPIVVEFITAAREALVTQQAKVSGLADYGTAAANHLHAFVEAICDFEEQSAQTFEVLK